MRAPAPLVTAAAVLTLAAVLTVLPLAAVVVSPRAVLGLVLTRLALILALMLALALPAVLTIAVAVAVQPRLLRLTLGLLAQGLAQHAGVMFGVLQETLLGHAVVRQLRIARKGQVFLDNLLRRAANLALGAGAVKHPVDDIAQRTLAVRLVARTGLG